KWLGSIFSMRIGWLWLGAIWGVGLVSSGLAPTALAMCGLSWFVYASFLAALGIWFSARCRTTVRATMWTLAGAVVIGMYPWAASMYLLAAAQEQISALNDYAGEAALFAASWALWLILTLAIREMTRVRFRQMAARMYRRRKVEVGELHWTNPWD